MINVFGFYFLVSNIEMVWCVCGCGEWHENACEGIKRNKINETHMCCCWWKCVNAIDFWTVIQIQTEKER